MKKIIFLCCVIILNATSCKDENNDIVLNSFISLTAENDTILTGQSTKITAVVDGENVTFQWSATAGDILGSGNEVNYVAPTCTPGTNHVSCTATASNNSESKSITITVF